MARRQSAELDRNLGLVLTFFCAGTPSTSGTLDLMSSFGVQREQVKEVRYRGEGWPGRFKVRLGADAPEHSYSYMESWGKLTGYRPLRCHLCPDGLGRIADIACGDAWENLSDDGDPGRSLVLVRTKRGQELLRKAREAGYVQLQRVTEKEVFAAQRSLLSRRREIFGRFAGMQALGVPVPTFKNFSLLQSWIRQSPWHLIRTVLGTMRRIIQRRQWRKRPLFST